MKRLAFLAPTFFAVVLLCFQSVQAQTAFPDDMSPSPPPSPTIQQPETGGMPPLSANDRLVAPKLPTPEPLPDALRQRDQAELKKPSASDGWTRPSAFGQNCAVYFTLQGGVETDTLKSVSTAWADKVDVNQTTIDEQGVAHMAVLPELDVAAESRIEFSPRGLHLMVMGLKRELRAGQFFPVILNFEHAGQVRVMVSVRKLRSTDTAVAEPVMVEAVQPPAVAPEIMPPTPQPEPAAGHVDMNHTPH